MGDITIDIPHDRNGEFEPQIILKGHRRIDGFDDKIVALYFTGDVYRDPGTPAGNLRYRRLCGAYITSNGCSHQRAY